MRSLWGSLLVWLAACSAAAAAPSRVRIELLPQVRVEGDAVVLGQVAWLHSQELPLIRALADLPLGKVPLPGETATLDRDTLSSWILRHVNLRPDEVDWGGAHASRVSMSTQSLTGHAIAAAAEVRLQAWLLAHGGRAEIRAHATPRDLELPMGALRLEVRTPSQGAPRKRMLVWVDLWVAGRFVRTVPVGFDVAVWKEVPVFPHALDRNARIEAEGIERRLTDVTEAPESVPLAIRGTLRARRSLRTGEALSRRDLEPVPEVERGQWAVLHAGTGAVRTEARVQVLQDGRRGDQVRVRHATAGALLLARVTGRGQLELAR